MKVALYIGSHEKDTAIVRFGHWLTIMSQKGGCKVTHGEAILEEHDDGTVDIASATLRKEAPGNKKGVRIKKGVRLTRGNWKIFNVTQIDTDLAHSWFIKHEGYGYDIRGAFASVWPFRWHTTGRFFCYQAICEASGIKYGEAQTGSTFEGMLMRFGRDVTEEFFSDRLFVSV